VKLNPLDVIFWTFRRNEKDVVNLYNTLSPVMQTATGGDMLNFGYWDNNTDTPIIAQQELCSKVGKLAELDSAENLLDVGSGIGGPAKFWSKSYTRLNIMCINSNFTQLQDAVLNADSENVNQCNSISAKSPCKSNSFDRIIALESAQHFKNIENFISESNRVLKDDGIFVIAIPVANKSDDRITKLGILSFTWSSEHYGVEHIKEKLKEHNLEIMNIEFIGEHVYPPLTDFYSKNRSVIKEKLNSVYPSYLEGILHKSLLKMKKVSNEKIIDYVLIKCKKLAPV